MSKEQGSESAVSGSKLIKEEEMAEEKEAPRKVSRRQFVKGAAVGGAGVAAAGMLASCAPAATPAPGETAAPAPTCPPAGECPPAETPWLPEKWDMETDVVVVGFGGAGGGAAIGAANAGAKVILLEKMPEGEEGGNTGVSGGGSWCPQNYEAAVEYTKGCCFGTSSDELIEFEVAEYLKLPEWFASMTGGEIFELAESDPEWPGMPGASEMGCATIRPSEGEGMALISFLRTNAEERGVEILFGSPAKKLFQHPETKEILGVLAETEGGEITIKAKKGVVLTAGGFEFNEDMKRSYLGPYPSYGTGCPGNTGDGIHMAMEAGGDLKNMRNVKGFRFCPKVPDVPDFKGTYDYFGRKEYRVGGSAIMVNKYGKRFLDESEHEKHGQRLQGYWLFFDGNDPLPGRHYEYPNVPSYMIFDEAKRLYKAMENGSGWVLFHLGYKWDDDCAKEIEKGWVPKADTLSELATKINDTFPEAEGMMDPAVLEETVRKYNEYCAAGYDPEFLRGSKPGSPPEWLVPIGDPPYYSIQIWPGMSCTEGGPKRNEKSEVLDRYDQPIPRLYSGGEMGSLWGFCYQGGSNVGGAIITGRVGGENAAALEPWG